MKYQSNFLFSFFSFLCALSLCHGSMVAQNNGPRNITVPVHVGIVLDLKTRFGKMSMSCISMAVSDFYATHSNYTTRLVLHTRDSKNDVVAAASAALDLIKNVGVQAIIGPQRSDQAEFLVDLGSKAHVPIVSFSAVSSSLSTIRTPYFIRTAQNDSSQGNAIAAIIRAFGWRSVVVTYEDTDYGNGLIPYLIDAFQEIDARISYRSVIPVSATDELIVGELYKLMTMQTRVFIVHMAPSLASRFFSKANEIGMMSEGYIWIITDVLTNLLDSLDSSVIDSMQGVLGVKQYVDKTKEMDDFMVRWRKNFSQLNPNIDRSELSIFGIRAYDTVWALAVAAERVGAEKSHFRKPEIGENSTELENLGVCQTGPKLLNAIKKTRFKGLGCEFHLVDGELPSSVFQIVNVIGKGERKVGFWTPNHGISRNLNMNLEKAYSTSMENFGPIIWPGDTSTMPKGWVIPTNGKKLRIGVPIKQRFTEFLKVEKNPLTNTTTVSGYCIDIFKSVIEALPYAVPYEFIPYQRADGQRAGSYDDLIYQVYLQKFDAMVADTTITANRSLYVDFTLPYTESDVSMIVPIKDDDSKKTWIFLKPLTLDLWLTSGAFFIFTGFVVWVLEHRLNDEFRGPPSQQLGVIFWFSFSTLVFAHKEKLVNNLSRFVVIIWVFVVLVLTSSYTASLTSMLTVQQLQPTITNVADLKKTGEYVGHLNRSFMTDFMKHFDFDKSKLKPITTEEYAEALSKGSRNGGVSAIFDEIPYLKLFLPKYCDKYTMVGPTYKTGGFGFVFQKGSPLVPDVSRAILNVTEGDTIAAIEWKWFGHQTTCRDQSATVASNSLTLSSFRGLFLIAGIASTSALTIFLVSFFFEHKHVFITSDSNSSISKRLIALAHGFDQKEISMRTLQKSHEDNNGIVISTSPVQASPTSQWTLSISNCTSGRFDPQEDEEIS